jgi:thiol-disulfide isomerase/thioredoxin
MKRFELLLFVLLACLASGNSGSAQSGRVKDPTSAPPTGEANKANEAKPADLSANLTVNANDPRTALQLFEDADNYTQKKFAEFEKRQMPYDQRIEEKIKQEQRDLAGQYATILATRKLEGQDVHYLGLLYNLARNFDAALETMRRFLSENQSATGEPAQNARAIIVIQAAKRGLLPEAENHLAEYAQNQPQVADDRYVLENWMVSGYFKTSDYKHALPHAQEMWSAAKVSATKKGPFARDTMLNEAVTLLSEAELKSGKPDQAIAQVQELRVLALRLPSANLYKLALRRLLQLDPRIDLSKLPDVTEAATTPPDIGVKEWIDQQPTKLSELRGRVVLLDFWATWCGPCREALPHMQKLAKKFEGEPLVVLSVSLDENEQKWKDFIAKNGMTWPQYLDGGFTGPVSRMFAVNAIPHTFTIDADGVLQDEQIGDSSVEGKLKKLISRAKELQTKELQAADKPKP